MAELPSRVYLLDTAELCMAAGQLLARRADDSEAVQLASGPIISWAMAWHDELDADARRKAVKLVLAGMGLELERAPGGTAIRDAAAFVAAAEAWRHTLMCATTVPGGHPEFTPDPPAAPPPAVPGSALTTGRVLYLVRNLLSAAFTTPGERERLVATAVRYGRTSEAPPTTSEYAAVLAWLFRHSYPGTAGTGYATRYDPVLGQQPTEPPGAPQPAATDPADSAHGRNPGAYGPANGQNGGAGR
jgi:hypothetical protein